MPDEQRMSDPQSRVPQEVDPPTDLGPATPPDLLGDAPDGGMFSPRDGETSTAGMNYGGADAVGSSPQDLPGGTFDASSGLGSDEAAATSRENVAGDSALGSDPSTIPATIGGQTLMAESDNATTRSNIGGGMEPEDTSAL